MEIAEREWPNRGGRAGVVGRTAAMGCPLLEIVDARGGEASAGRDESCILRGVRDACAEKVGVAAAWAAGSAGERGFLVRGTPLTLCVDMRNSPKVTVVMPAFNAAPYVAEAIESILAQTDQDFELIVVNDGSTDDTACVLFRFDRHPRIRLITFAAHAGEAVVTNVAVAAARGDYVARMDADDVANPDRRSVQIEILECNPQVTMTGGQATFIDHSAGALPQASRVLFADADRRCRANSDSRVNGMAGGLSQR